MARRPALRPLAIAVTCVLPCGPIAVADESQLARFQREYPSAAERLEDALSRAVGRAVRIDVQAGSASVEEDFAFAVDGSSQQTTSRRKGEGADGPWQVEVVRCVTDDGGFVVYRETEDGPYGVEGLGHGPRERGAMNHLLGRFFAGPYAVNGVPLSTLMRQPSFKLNAASAATLDGREVVKIEFEFGSQVRNFGEVTLDPGRGWAILEGRTRSGSAWSSEFQVEYEPGRSDPVIPSVVRFVTPPDRESECRFTEFRLEAPPAGDFLISSYGLDDSLVDPRPKSRGISAIAWLTMAAVGGLLAAVALRVAAARLRRD